MLNVWWEDLSGTAPAQGLYSHAGLARGGTLTFIAGLRVGAKAKQRGRRAQPFPKLK
jgi:hypothetical protein